MADARAATLTPVVIAEGLAAPAVVDAATTPEVKVTEYFPPGPGADSTSGGGGGMSLSAAGRVTPGGSSHTLSCVIILK